MSSLRSPLALPGNVSQQTLLDFGRLPDGAFHSLRIALFGAIGVMPEVRDEKQTDGTRYASLGLSLTVGFGAH
jgi:hypothetical protein